MIRTAVALSLALLIALLIGCSTPPQSVQSDPGQEDAAEAIQGNPTTPVVVDGAAPVAIDATVTTPDSAAPALDDAAVVCPPPLPAQTVRIAPPYAVDGGLLVIAEGDSITQGIVGGGGQGASYPAIASALLDKSNVVIDVGIAGETLATMVADESAHLGPHIADAGGRTIVATICAGTNDFAADAGEAEVFANLVTWVQTARAMGATRVLVVDLPLHAVYITPAEYAAYRADMASLEDGGLAEFVTFPGVAHLGGDGTHPLQPGYYLMGGIYAEAIGAGQ